MPIHSPARPAPLANVTTSGPVNDDAVRSSVSVGPVTVSVTALDVPPPGAGVTTVIACVPPLPTSAAESATLSCVPDAYVVGRALPSTCTTEDATKLVPVTVSVRALALTPSEV